MDEGSSNKLPSNKEVIDEITKNLEHSCLENEGDNKVSIDASYNAEQENNGEEVESKRAEKESKVNIDPFFVDEEEIKSRDFTLSDSEKETLKKEAENLKLEGNSLFKEGNYEEATKIYTLALRTLPLEYQKERAILYANSAAAKSKFIVDKEIVIIDCTKAIELDPNYMKAYLRRANLYETTEKLDEALEDFKKILTFDSKHPEAISAVMRLPPKIEERNEKLKTEMLGKLKDLGNMILKPFGLSTNNFEFQKDPNSGGYSVKLNQNPT